MHTVGTCHVVYIIRSCNVLLLRVPQSAWTQETTRIPRTAVPQRTSDPKTAAASTTKPYEEIHLRLGTQDMINCFRRSKVSKVFSKAFFYLRDRIEASKFYADLYALRGSITAEATFDKEHLRNLSRKSNFRCQMYQIYDEYCCAFRVRVPRGRYVAAVLYGNAGSVVELYDSKWTRLINDDFDVDTGSMAGSLIFLAHTNVVNIIQVFQLRDRYARSRLVVRFFVVDDPGLQVKHTVHNTGVVQTPLYYERSFLLTPVLHPRAAVEVPSGHVIMVSSAMFLDTLEHCVELRDGGSPDEALLRRICPGYYSNRLRVFVYNSTSLLLVRFEYNNPVFVGNAMFRIFFSFLSSAALPTPSRLPDDTWNCSVPSYRRELLHHLSCNKEVDCHDAEDEADCPYTSDLCGPGHLTLGGSCFFFLRRPEPDITSRDASEQCSSSRRPGGGGLAVLLTRDSWEEARRFLGKAQVFLGLTTPPLTLPRWYSDLYLWTEQITAFYIAANEGNVMRSNKCRIQCGVVVLSDTTTVATYVSMGAGCRDKVKANILCKKKLPQSESTQHVILVNATRRWPRDNDNMTAAYVECPLGHYTHQFLVCDFRSSCWSHAHSSSDDDDVDDDDCGWPQTPPPPYFACSNRKESVPYTLVCDLRADCGDRSDEDFCTTRRCSDGEFSCENGQCIPPAKVCDGWKDCNNNDEDELPCEDHLVIEHYKSPPPLIVDVSEEGKLVTKAMQRNGTCPHHTHFRCQDNEYCLPIFLRCNGVHDCPGREDEGGCESCPGFYRCRESRVCLAYSHLCDGHPHCPQHDDELMCDSSCPAFCVCRGLAFFCGRDFSASSYPYLRFLDARGSFLTPTQLTGNFMLIHLILADCGLSRLDDLFLPNLLTLNVRGNRLSDMSRVHLSGVPQLRELLAADNPLSLVFADGDEGPPGFNPLLELDLSRVVLKALNVSALSVFPKLRFLNLSHSRVQRVSGEGFRSLKQLRVLDLRGCPMTWFPRRIFQDLHHLRTVHADSFKMCCPKVLPLYFKISNCFAPSNEVSSCDNLLRGYEYRVCAFLLSALAMTGNAVSFIFRAYKSKRERKPGYVNFVTHLSVSDFIMGVYLAIIGVADQVFHGTYLWNDVAWRHGAVCKFAGFLSLLSSEVSVLIVCLITLDRFLVLRFPFSRLHFTNVSSHAASAVVWFGGFLLALVPLLPATLHWEFYSQTGICIPLPITRTKFPGYSYSFCILVVLNFVVFVAISAGQVSIYWSVQANSMAASSTTRKRKDLSIARRLITVAMTDFLCWFPVCVLGLMASNGVSVSGEVNVAVAIFVLPLNSAINPCLYTFGVIKERRDRVREENLRKILLAQLMSRN